MKKAIYNIDESHRVKATWGGLWHMHFWYYPQRRLFTFLGVNIWIPYFDDSAEGVAYFTSLEDAKKFIKSID